MRQVAKKSARHKGGGIWALNAIAHFGVLAFSRLTSSLLNFTFAAAARWTAPNAMRLSAEVSVRYKLRDSRADLRTGRVSGDAGIRTTR